MRNYTKRWFNILKAELKTFYNDFPYRSTLYSIAKLLKSFIAI
jgi:hypothetical protein